MPLGEEALLQAGEAARHLGDGERAARGAARGQADDGGGGGGNVDADEEAVGQTSGCGVSHGSILPR